MYDHLHELLYDYHVIQADETSVLVNHDGRKANNLKPYDYFEYLLEEIPKHMEDTDQSFLNELLPWSENLPEHIRKKQ